MSTLESTTKPIKVLIVDDESINRLGIRYLLTGIPEIEIIGEAENGQSAIEQSLICKPDVILMDLDMPVLDGLAATTALRQLSQEIKILIITSSTREQDLIKTLSVGANGYCLKDSNPEQLLTAIRTAWSGGLYVDSKMHEFLKQALSSPKPAQPTNEQKTETYPMLSMYEVEILSLKMNGVKDEDVAIRLGISIQSLLRIQNDLRQKMIDLEIQSARLPHVDCVAHICPKCGRLYSSEVSICLADGAQLILQSLTNRLGTTIGGKYDLVEFIGRGGGATVFKARHRYLNQYVAIKVINAEFSTDFTMLQRFRGEAELASKLKHGNIVDVNDFGLTDSGTPYLVMELLTGVDLSSYISARGRLDVKEFKTIFSQVCDALTCAHESGLVHRDIKPGNIFLSLQSQQEPTVKLLDFGLAKAVIEAKAPSLTQTGQIVGTPSYMSPEKCRGAKEEFASDIYSLGCSMFECLTGRLPFGGDCVMDTMVKHMRESAPAVYPAGALGEEIALEAIILKCLQKDPASRFASTREIKRALSASDVIAA